MIHKREAGVFKSPSWCPKTPFTCKWKAKREEEKSVPKIIQIQRYPYVCTGQYGFVNRPFPGSPGPLFQNEVRCSAFDMEMIFHSHANKTHFHKKGCALGLILKVRVLKFGSGLLLRDKTSPIQTGIL